MEYFKLIITVEETTSTMDLAKLLTGSINPPFVVRALKQTEGRGQYGRSWISNVGGLFFTEVLSLNNVLGFSTFLAIPIVRVIKRYVKEVKIKWPNDIVVNRKKLGGILVENSVYTYAGIGINVSNDVGIFENIATRVSSFSSVNPLRLFYEILEEESSIIEEFLKNGFRKFVDEYNEHLAILGEFVKIDAPNLLEGLVVSVGENGELLLKNNNEIVRVFSGSIIDFYKMD